MSEGEKPEAGFCWVAALDHPAHLSGRPGGGMAFFGQMPGAERIFVIAHAVRETLAGVALVGQEEVVVVDSAQVRATFFVEEHVVKAYAVALRVDVQLADGVGLVTGVAEGLRHGWHVGHRLGGFEDAVAVCTRGGAGHQGATCGNADGAFAIGVGEAGAAAGEGIQSWCEDRGVLGFA